MKKLMIFVFMSVTLCIIGTITVSGINCEKEYSEKYYKGNIRKEELPQSIIEYLDKEYPGYTIIKSARKNNGTYFVKIRYSKNKYRPFYRSLVFDHEGNTVKG